MDYDTDVSHRPHKLRVDSYNEAFKAHECFLDEDPKRRVFVDLLISGCLPEEIGEDDLDGKLVEVDYTHGFVWLAEGVRILGDARETGHGE